MDALDIRHMHAHYRLPAGSAGDLRSRLAAIQSSLLDGALEEALEQAGIRPDEEVCVRQLRVPVRLRGLAAGTRGDTDLAADWAAAVAASLVDTLEHGDDSVVRYRGRMQAWADCAAGVALGNLSRAWAWRRLGLWRGGADLSPPDAAAELVRGLIFAPQAVVPVLIGLADQGALTPLARRLDPPSWCLLAAAALDAHGASRTLLEGVEAVPTPQAQDGGSHPSAHPRRDLRSDIDALAEPAAGSPLLALGQVTGTANARPIAVLMLLASDPALGLRPLREARGRVERLVAELLGQRSDQSGPTQPPGTESTSKSAAQLNADATNRSSRGTGYQQPKRSFDVHSGETDTPTQVSPAPATGRPEARLDVPGIPDGLSPRTPEACLLMATAEPPDREQDRVVPKPGPGVRPAQTAWGGLLLLLNLIESAGLLEPDAPLPPGRPLRWTLHRLAQALAPVAADDPAALAFAGLSPTAQPPSRNVPESSADEEAVIATLRGQIVSSLHQVVDDGEEHPEALLARICRRPAEILADPGWIEVCFPLATLSTEVRRAGLDLDPNWLPWLGAVVRFRYA